MTPALLLASLLASSAQESPPQKYYLCVGVGEYRDSSILDLYGPDRDAEEFAKRLDSLGWKPISPHLVSRRGSDKEYRNGVPARNDVLSALDEAVSRCRRQDDFLLFFSGHGNYYDKSDLLLPWDTAYEGDRLKLPSVISLENDIKPRFTNLKSDRRIVILNMCRAEIDDSQAQMSGEKGYDAMLPRQFRGSSSLEPLLLWSCKRGEVSYAPPKAGSMTLFGEELIGAVDKAVAQEEPFINSIIDRTVDKVKSKTGSPEWKEKYTEMTPDSSGINDFKGYRLGRTVVIPPPGVVFHGNLSESGLSGSLRFQSVAWPVTSIEIPLHIVPGTFSKPIGFRAFDVRIKRGKGSVLAVQALRWANGFWADSDWPSGLRVAINGADRDPRTGTLYGNGIEPLAILDRNGSVVLYWTSGTGSVRFHNRANLLLIGNVSNEQFLPSFAAHNSAKDPNSPDSIILGWAHQNDDVYGPHHIFLRFTIEEKG